jgi:hypothetical protein
MGMIHKKLSWVLVFQLGFLQPLSGIALADYTNLRVVEGDANALKITPDGLTFTAPAGMIVEVDDFDIAQGQTYVFDSENFYMRVVGNSSSQINGSLVAMGQFILSNPNGVNIGALGKVQGSAILSTLNLSNEMFLDNTLTFEKLDGSSTGVITNAGIIDAGSGHTALLAEKILNTGTITARLGSIALGSGEKQTLSFDNDGRIQLVVDRGVSDALAAQGPTIENGETGKILADGGKITMSAKAVSDTLTTLINQKGLVKSTRAVERDGAIYFESNGAISNTSTGIIDTSYLMEHGYTFNLLGSLTGGIANFVNLDRAATIGANGVTTNLGINVSDPDNIFIYGTINLTADVSICADANSCVGDGGKGNMTMAVGSSFVGNGYNLTLMAADKFQQPGPDPVQASVLKAITGVNILTLNKAGGNSSEAPTYSMSSSETLSVNELRIGSYVKFYHFAGSGTSGDPYLIASALDLQAMKNITSGYFKLSNDINLASTATWNSNAGWDPVNFTGNFNGNNKTISNLTINRAGGNYQGLFGTVGSSSSLYDLNLTSVNVSSSYAVGGLAGYTTNTTVSNVTVAGSVQGSSSTVGGLIGFLNSGTISNSSSTATVTGVGSVGGLVGISYTATVSGSYASGAVTGTTNVGGLIGSVNSGTISNSSGRGNVTGTDYVGGLVGQSDDFFAFSSGALGGDVTGAGLGTVYASGNVTGTNYVGGLVGGVIADYTGSNANAGGLFGTVDDSSFTSIYSSGNVTGTNAVGGLVGLMSTAGTSTYENHYGGLIGHYSGTGSMGSMYASGTISGTTDVGGLVGRITAANVNSTNYIGGEIGYLANNLAPSGIAFNGSVSGTTNVDRIAGKMTDSTTGGITKMGSLYGYPYPVPFVDIWAAQKITARGDQSVFVAGQASDPVNLVIPAGEWAYGLRGESANQRMIFKPEQTTMHEGWEQRMGARRFNPADMTLVN